jgi:large subunit ribosomal protein L9
LNIATRSGEEDKLFGSVSNESIAEALALQDVKVDKRDIILSEPIKKLGIYQVTVKLHPEVKAVIKVSIIKE